MPHGEKDGSRAHSRFGSRPTVKGWPATRAATAISTLAVLAGVLGVLLLGSAGTSPAGAQASPGERPSAADSPSEEVLSLRTRTSRTYRLPDGSHRAVISAGSVNFRDASGKWVPIDDSLVASSRPGYAYENRANRYTVLLPADLASAPVRVEHGHAWVSIALLGAKGVARVSGQTARYADVLPGVTLAYTALADQVKETLTLASPAAAAGPFAFRVETSPDLTARSDGRRLSFLDARGKRALAFAAPNIVDGRRGAEPVEVPLAMSVAKSAGSLVVTLTPDPAWVADPARSWPLEIDPTVELEDTQDCHLASAAAQNTSNCGTASVKVGYSSVDTRIRRGLFKFDLSGIPNQVTVQNAQLNLYCQAASTGNSADIIVRRVLPAGAAQAQWTNQATWNKYNGTNAWNTPGGDLGSQNFATRNTNCSTLGWKSWYPDQLVQGWVDHASSNGNTNFPNHGLALRQTGSENVNNILDFASLESSIANPAGSPCDGQTAAPCLVVHYDKWKGDLRYWRYEEMELSDRMNLKVNVASGNLVLRAQDLRIAGTAGHDLTLTRFNNSLGTAEHDFGQGWTLGTGDDVELTVEPNGDVRFAGPSDYRVVFARGATSNGITSYTKPPGFNADLTKNETTGVWTMTFRNGSKYVFNAAGDLTSHKDRNDNTISFSYSGGQVSSITDTHGRQVSFSYTDEKVTSISDVAGGRTLAYTYDASSDELLTYTDAEGEVTSYDYDANHNLTEITDPRGNTIEIAYGTGSKVSSITRVTDSTTDVDPQTTFSYAVASSPCAVTDSTKTVVTDPENHTTTYCSDKNGVVTKVLDANGNSVSTSYTSNRDVQTATSAESALTTFGYTSLDRVSSITAANSASASLTYDTTHTFLPKTYADAQGNTTTYGYDAKGNVKSATNQLPTEHTVDLNYNADGTLDWAKDAVQVAKGASGVKTDLSYTNHDLTAIDYPAPLGDVSFAYDAISRLASFTDGKGNERTFAYDDLDRLTSITYDDSSSVNYGYDENGNLTSRIDANGTTTYTYDELNRLTQEAHPGGVTISYAYDRAGNMSSLTDAGGTVDYEYDPVNLVSKITEPNDNETTFSYCADHKRKTTKYPNGITVKNTYTADRLTEVAATTANVDSLTCSQTVPTTPAPLLKFTYSYTQGTTARDLRQSVTDKNGNKTTYTYDKLNRLIQARTTNSGGTQISNYQYAYDGNSNRCKEYTGANVAAFTCSTAPASSKTYRYNDANELCWTIAGASSNTCANVPTGGTAYTWDANGNWTGGSGASANYNLKDQTTSITPIGGSHNSFSYADRDQYERVSANGGTITNNALGVGSNATRHFTRDDKGGLVSLRTSSTTSYYPLFAALGSVIALTEEDGDVAGDGFSYQYDPFGKPLNDPPTGYPNNPWRFAGTSNYYFDSGTGLYKVGLRYYDPALARWTQKTR
jgi:RHS repeat-associated protein